MAGLRSLISELRVTLDEAKAKTNTFKMKCSKCGTTWKVVVPAEGRPTMSYLPCPVCHNSPIVPALVREPVTVKDVKPGPEVQF